MASRYTICRSRDDITPRATRGSYGKSHDNMFSRLKETKVEKASSDDVLYMIPTNLIQSSMTAR